MFTLELEPHSSSWEHDVFPHFLDYLMWEILLDIANR